MIDVTCSVEGDYVPHSAAMLHSVLSASRDRVRVHYLHGQDFPGDASVKLEAMVDELGGAISFVAAPADLCDGLPTEGFTGEATWYRAFLPELLPDLDRVVSLDADLIATEDLGPLFETDLDGRFLAAVTNVLAPEYLRRPWQLGLEPRQYFNAGVMVMDLELMRRERCVSKIRSYGIEHASELALRDQDALNFVLAANRTELHPRWNCMNSMFEYPWAFYVFTPEQIDEAARAPAIRHFEGPARSKPWHYVCRRDHRQLYDESRRRTPWPSYRPEGKTAAAVARKALQRVRRMVARDPG